mmetsp:Transcript_21388/g.63932  ORF Transcript_21388/g.63932 Transcript_21388/m.63932 type:complete len:240 (-) Transcript_21388:689-1408(-)
MSGRSQVVKDLASQAFGEPAVLFKDKINFKGPGGAGFLAHQDATAYATGRAERRRRQVDHMSSEETPPSSASDASTRVESRLRVDACRGLAVKGERRRLDVPRPRDAPRVRVSRGGRGHGRQRGPRGRAGPPRGRRLSARRGRHPRGVRVRTRSRGPRRRRAVRLVPPAPQRAERDGRLAALGLPHVQRGARGRLPRGLLRGEGRDDAGRRHLAQSGFRGEDRGVKVVHDLDRPARSAP